MKKKIFAVLLLSAVSCAVAFAQKMTVTGKVNDTKGNPVPGAVVMLDGSSSVAVVTSDDGTYSISIPDASAAKLNVSILSYRTQTVAVAGRAVIDIVLEDDAEQLDEVVVVGYGAMKRSDLTGAVTSVHIDEGDAAQSSSLDQLLQGHASGVQVVNNSAAPDAGVSIRIRGVTSLTGSSDPLYVVDGVILTSADNSMLAYGSDNTDANESNNPLMGINPQDIANIEILKDASATAIYGSEGANGVVLITTKMANKEKPQISFSAGLDFVTMAKTFPVLSFDEYVRYVEDNVTNTGRESILSRMFDGYVDPSNRGTLKVTPVDWQDYSLRNVLRQRYYFNVSGRPKTLTYNFSLGYNRNDGIVKTTGMNQITARLNIEKQILRTLKVGAKINFSHVESKGQQGANGGRQFASSSMLRSMLISRPYYKGTLEDFNGDEENEDWDTIEEDSKSTPNRWLKDSYNNRALNRVTPNVYVLWDIIPALKLKVTGGLDYNINETTKWKGASINRTTGGATASISSAEAVRWNIDAMLMFDKSFGRGGFHNLSGTFGFTTDNRSSYTQQMLGYNIRQYELKSANINSAPNAVFAYTETSQSTASAFLRAVYNYHDRYVITATARLDGSSKFKGSNKFAFFPSFAAAWRINQEPWFKVDWISQAKIRAGWGQVGNSGVSPYQTYVTYSNNTFPSHDPDNPATYSVGIVPSNIANPNLKWETTQQWNVGADIGFFKGRLSLSFDAYDKFTFDLLNTKNIAITSGFNTTWVNQGQIRNRGLEFSLNTVPVKTKNFEWGVRANISFNRNSIVNIGTDSEGEGIYLTPDKLTQCNYYLGDQIGNGRYFSKCVNIFIEGQPVGLFYGIKTDGIVQEGEQGPGFGDGKYKGEGSLKYVDLNGNGYIDDNDRTIIGDPNPDFTYGFTTDFTFFGVTVALNFNGSYGNDICNSNINQLIDTQYSSMNNICRDAYFKAWSPANPTGTFPGLGKYTSNDDSQWFTDFNVEDGSYLRLAKISVSYKLPIKKSFVRQINFGLSANNVYVWTKYSGWDPEVNSFGVNMRRMGIDNGSYPGSRSFSFDLKLNF